jgi:prepilin-type N-terminal cleavage/methylation domain-containing protein
MKRFSKGFTLIELIVTLTLGMALIIAFFSLYRSGLAINTNSVRNAAARNYAYSEVRKYAQAQPSQWPASGTGITAYSCATSVSNASSGGQTIKSTPITDSELPAPATLTVKALARYGCSAANEDMPVQVEATVQYGTTNQKAVYATYTKEYTED